MPPSEPHKINSPLLLSSPPPFLTIAGRSTTSESRLFSALFKISIHEPPCPPLALQRHQEPIHTPPPRPPPSHRERCERERVDPDQPFIGAESQLGDDRSGIIRVGRAPRRERPGGETQTHVQTTATAMAVASKNANQTLGDPPSNSAGPSSRVDYRPQEQRRHPLSRGTRDEAGERFLIEGRTSSGPRCAPLVCESLSRGRITFIRHRYRGRAVPSEKSETEDYG